MSVICRENVLRILTELIGLPSVNPMGRAYEGAEPVEREVAEYIAALFAGYDVEVIRQAYSGVHENLLVVVPGREEGPGLLFESHMDTVPAEDWQDRAFAPRVEGERVFGRGACDDKGPLTAMILALLDLIESGATPARPVLLLAAGDEEYAQTGIKQFRSQGYVVDQAVFGEPTELRPIIQHKGTVRWDITVHGRSAHTARPELGSNAILGMVEVIRALREHERDLQARHRSPLISGPTLTVTMIHGGRTRNAVPDACTIAVDLRVLPGMELAAAREGVIGVLAGLGLKVTHSEPQLMTPALQTAPDDPFARRVLEICRQHAGAEIELAGVPYGTDAAWVADRASALVLGPGSIASAHAIDEEIDVEELLTGARIYLEIMRG